MTAPTVGQHVLMQYTTGRYHDATIANIVDGDQCDLNVFSDGGIFNWDEPVAGNPSYWPAVTTFNVDKGYDAGQWQEALLPEYSLEAIEERALAVCARFSTPGTSHVRDLGSPYQPDVPRATMVSVSGTWTWALEEAGTIEGSVTFFSDEFGSPGTPRAVASFSKTVTAASGGVEPYFLMYDVPPGHYYQLNSEGDGTISIDLVNESQE